MAKLTLSSIPSGYATAAAHNADNTAIETAIENTLSRDGTGPNQMNANLDMNGYAILNQRATSGANFIWMGTWVTGTTYAVNNLVYAAEGTNTGNTLICVVANTAGVTLDGDAAKWAVFTQRGASGAGTGDIIGPASSTADSLARFNGTTGKLLKDGAVIGTDVMAYDAGLAATTAFIKTLLNDPDAATALITLGVPLNTILPKSSAYSIVQGDRGKLIKATTGTWALGMDPVTLGANFTFVAKNSGTGTITLTPVTGTIDGLTTTSLNTGESTFVFCDGTNFETAGRTFSTYRTSNSGMPPAGSANSASHPLGRIPDNVHIELVCVIAEHGFGVGTVVEATGEWPGTGSASPIEIWKTSTNVGFNFSAGETFFLRDVSTGVAFIPTGANWVYRFALN